MEEAAENSKELSHSAHANKMNEYFTGVHSLVYYINLNIP